MTATFDIATVLDDDGFGFDTLGGIRALLHGYSGGISILRELAQNADDPPGDEERFLTLDFQPDQLVVSNNSSFRTEDFARIKRIAVAGKLTEQHRTTGTFGVGFVSVYQLTDSPVLRSSGYELRFMPEKGRAPATACNTGPGTVFELVYRRAQTKVGQALGMVPVTDGWIDDLLDRQMPAELPTMLLFTERLARITILRRGAPCLEVVRTIRPLEADPTIERVTISVRSGPSTQEHHWLRFRGQVLEAPPLRPDGRPAKDATVHVAVPEQDVPSQFWQETGRLFNYQPTNIITTLPFHINGDFYPSTDRKHIDDGNAEHHSWNRAVLTAISRCYAGALPSLLRYFHEDATALYHRLPLKAAELEHQQRLGTTMKEMVSPILSATFERARGLAIFRTLAGWNLTQEARWVSKEIRPIAEEAEPRLMSADLQNIAWELLRRLGVRQYTLEDFIGKVQSQVKPGSLLKDGPVYLRTPEQLTRLYRALEHDNGRQCRERLGHTPIFLDQRSRLLPADQCRLGRDSTMRAWLTEVGVPLWNDDHLTFPRLAALLQPVKLTDVWAAIRPQLAQELPLREAPAWLNTRTKLHKFYDNILRLSEPIAKGDVAKLALCLDRGEYLRYPVGLAIPDGEPRLYKMLAAVDEVQLADPNIADDQRYRLLYQNLGVKPFGVRQLIDWLEQIAPRETINVSEAHEALNSREKLAVVYRYLRDHREELDTRAVETLRHRVRIWVCRDNNLHKAVELRLPPDSPDWPDFLKIVRVAPFERRDSLHPLLEETLGMRPLDARQVIEQDLLPQYPSLSRKEQQEALRYLRTHTQLLKDIESLRQRAAATPLLYGDDDQLHVPTSMCFPESQLHQRFPGRFVKLHTLYLGGKQDVGPWQDLFNLLGVNRVATTKVVLDTIDQLRQRRPGEVMAEVERLFRYLEEHWERYYQSTVLGQRLREMPWLPAESDATVWHKPTELYQQTDKYLVDQVGLVLGIAGPRPQKAIADSLGFPNPTVTLVVRQLGKLSERKRAPHRHVYDFLNRMNASEADLKPLRGLGVIYDRESTIFWRGDQVFLKDYSTHFGAYRCYDTQSDYRQLFRRLGARDEPSPKDYIELIRELANRFRGAEVPDNETALLLNAYDILHNAPDELLLGLRDSAWVVSTAGGQERQLRVATMVILQPPDRYARHLKELPIALYKSRGEETLRRGGVRSINEVLDTKPLIAFDKSRERLLGSTLGNRFIAHAISRLLHHYSRTRDEERIKDELRRLRTFEQRAITVEYTVRLEREEYQSGPLTLDFYYERVNGSGNLYLREALEGPKLYRALADVLQQIIGIEELLPALLKDVLSSPSTISEILDDNRISPLPEPPDLHTEISSPTSFTLGGGDENEPEPDWPPPPALGEAHPPMPPAGGSRPPTSPAPDEPRPPTPPVGGSRPPTPPAPDEPRPPTPPVGGSRPPTRPAPGEPRPPTSPVGGSRPPTPPAPGEARPPMPPVGGSRPPSGQRPRFRGVTRLASPTKPTDVDGLRGRVIDWAKSHNLPLEGETSEPLRPPRVRQPNIAPAMSTSPEHVRFVLSYAEYSQGFLRLNNAAQLLFPGRPEEVRCTTDFGQSFPLWIEWDRQYPIAYNQDELSAFFATQGIPAGGIIYLERLHQGRYRLYYNRVPHQVTAVKLASNEMGQVVYETIEAMEVNCETDEAVFRAEKRHEDPEALWLEAVTKRSVEEMLCDLLMASVDGWMHEDELRALVETQRMLAAGTVAQTLRNKSYFVEDGHRYWRLDPARFMAAPDHEPIARWLQATTRLLSSGDQLLRGALDQISPLLKQLSMRVATLQQPQSVEVGVRGMAVTLEQLLAEPENELLGQELSRMVIARTRDVENHLASDTELSEILEQANDLVWALVLRPALSQTLERLAQDHSYRRRYEVAALWATQDEHHSQNLEALQRQAEAWEWIRVPEPAVADVLRALKHAPDLSITYDYLQITVQRDLYAVLGDGSPKQLAMAGELLAHTLQQLQPAFEQMPNANRTAFINTVGRLLGQCWFSMSDSSKISTSVLILQDFKGSLTPQQLNDLIVIARAAHQAGHHVDVFLLGQLLWLASQQQDMRRLVAGILAQCCDSLQVWELTLNTEWKRFIPQPLLQRIEQQWMSNNLTLVPRYQKLVTIINQTVSNPLGEWAAHLRPRFAKEIERRIQVTLRSMA